MSVLRSICNTARLCSILTSFFVFFTLSSMMEPDEHQFSIMKRAIRMQLLTAENQQLKKQVIDQEFYTRGRIIIKHPDMPDAYAIIHHTASTTGRCIKKNTPYSTIQPIAHPSTALEIYAERGLINFIATCIDPAFTIEEICALKQAAPTELIWRKKLYYWLNGVCVTTLKLSDCEQKMEALPRYGQENKVLIFPLSKKMIVFRDGPIDTTSLDDTTENLDYMITSGINDDK